MMPNWHFALVFVALTAIKNEAQWPRKVQAMDRLDDLPPPAEAALTPITPDAVPFSRGACGSALAFRLPAAQTVG